eukprot:c21624_g1_i1 orf=65-1132(+)
MAPPPPSNPSHLHNLPSPAALPNLNPRRKIIIDTDPGIDDAMTIFMAFQSPELEVIGLTTIFGNVETPKATENTLHLCEVAGFPDLPVAEGCSGPLKGGCPRVADFVHGYDGLGNTFPVPSKNKKVDKSAADFLIDKVDEFPGEVTIVALGPLTNIAQAMQKDTSFARRVVQIFILGGSFFASGNVTPAAEANIYGDPEAADIVFTSGAEIVVIGINLTTQITLTEEDLCEIRDSNGEFGKYVYDICGFYKSWHEQSDGFEGIFLHDPTCLAALLDPTLFSYKRGAVRVETQGICIGHTVLDLGLKNWNASNPWTNQPFVSVGWTVNTEAVTTLVKERLKSSRFATSEIKDSSNN